MRSGTAPNAVLFEPNTERRIHEKRPPFSFSLRSLPRLDRLHIFVGRFLPDGHGVRGLVRAIRRCVAFVEESNEPRSEAKNENRAEGRRIEKPHSVHWLEDHSRKRGGADPAGQRGPKHDPAANQRSWPDRLLNFPFALRRFRAVK